MRRETEIIRKLISVYPFNELSATAHLPERVECHFCHNPYPKHTRECVWITAKAFLAQHEERQQGV
jgi:hypothetical protein